jgi:autotransporter-associated beta strand protein
MTFNGSIGGTGTPTLHTKGKFNFNGPVSESYTGGLNIVTTGGAAASSTITFNKPLGTVAVPDNSLVSYGVIGGSGQVNLRMSASNQFGDNVRIDFNNPSGQWSRFDLMGTSQALAGITTGNFVTQGAGVIQNRESSGTANRGTSTFTLNGDTTDPLYPVGGYTYNGHLRDADSGVSATNQLNLVKDGSGTQTLVGGVITHSGTTTVNAGTLVFAKTSALNTSIVNNATVVINAVSGDDWILNNGKTLSGAGTWNKTGLGRASINSGIITATGQINILGGSLRNNNNAGNWTASTASIDVSSGATLDLFADAIYLDKLTGSGSVENGFGNAAGSQTGASAFFEKLVVGVANGSSTFSGTVRNNSGNNLPNSGTTAGGGGLEIQKEGSGTLTLSGTVSYTGLTNINNGVLEFASASNNTLAGAVNGVGALVKSGNGILTLNGNNGLGGTTTINAGTLAIGGTAPNTAITLNTSGSLRVGATGKTLSTIAMATGTSLELPATTGQTTNSGNLSLDSSPAITVKPFFPGAPVVGTYDLLTPASITGAPASITTDFGSYDNARGVTGSTTITGGKLVLDVTGTFTGAANLVWDNLGGAGNGNWSVITPADNNFDNGGSPDMFFDLDHVAFNGAGTGTVNLTGPVLPASLAVNSSTGDYTFSGAGSINGPTSLVKSGSSALTITSSNTFSGGTTLNAGTLNANAPSALGSGSALTLNGGLLALGAANVTSVTPTLSFPSGSIATLRLNGHPLTVTSLNSGFPYVSPHSIESGSATAGSDTLTVNNATDNVFAGTLADGAARALALSKTGSGTLSLVGSGSNTYTGETTMTAGRIGLGKTGGAVAIQGDFIGDNFLSPDVFTTENNQFGTGSAMYFVNPNGDHVRFELLGTTQTLAGLDNSAAALGGRGVVQHREQAVPAQIDGQSTLILNVPAFESYSYNGYLRNNGGLLEVYKDGPGTQTFSGANITYSNTTIDEGKLVFASANVGRGTMTINNGGTLDLTGANAVDQLGDITINAGGVLNDSIAAHNTKQIYLNGGSITASAPGLVSFGNFVLNGNVNVAGSQQSVISADIRSSSNADRVFTVSPTGDPSGVDLEINGRIGHLNNVAWSYMTKSGTGTMRFNNPALVSDIGRITVNEGRLVFRDQIATMSNGGLVINKPTANPSVVEVNTGTAISVTYGGGMSGTAGTLQKTGPGTLALTNAGTTYSGGIEVAEGQLSLPTRAATHGDISVATGAKLRVTGGSGVVASTGLNLATGSALQLLNFTGDAVIAPMDVTTTNPVFTGTVPVEVSGITTTGSFPLILYPLGGDVAGDGVAALSLVLPRSIEATVVDNTLNDSVDLSVTDINPVTWVGNEGPLWETDPGNTNWEFEATATAYEEGDLVLLDDTANTFAVTLDETIAPSAVTFDNSANDYTLSGSGAITGPAKLTKSGTGKLTITGGHTHTGGTVVNAGVLELGDGTTNGSLAGTIANEANLTFNNGLPQTLSTVLSGTGSLTKTGAGTLTVSTAQNHAGGTNAEAGIVQLFGSNNGNSSAGTGTLTINAGATVEANSHNTLGQATGAALSPLVINGGTFLGDAYNHVNSITLTAGVIGVRTGVTPVDGIYLRTREAVTPTLTSLASTSPSTVSSKMTIADNTTVTVADGDAASDLVVSGSIVGAGTFTKDGMGTLELSGASTYTGATTVSAGTLLLNAGSLGNTATTVATGATLAGSGTATGAVTIQGGATVSPGSSGTGILSTGAATLAGTYACEINGAAADRVNVTGNLDVTGATIAFSEIAAPTEPEYIIATYTGTLSGTVPATTGLPAGYALDIATTGQIKLVSAEGYDAWATLKGLDGSNNDPAFDADKDGTSNLMEFYLDGNPLANDPSILPASTVNGTYLTLSFKRRDDAEAEMTVELVQYGTDLAVWQDTVLGAGSAPADGNGVIVNITENDADADDIEVLIPRTLAVGGRLFGRLKVTE